MKFYQSSLLLALGQIVVSQRIEGIETSVEYPGLSDSCLQALNTTVTNCPGFLGSISVDNPRLRSEQLSWLCTSDCQTSLQDVRKTIVNGCSAKSDNITYGGTVWPATFIIDRFLHTYNLSCRKDSDSGKYCDDVFVLWLNGSRLTASQNCSDCMLGVMQIQLNSPFGYDEDFEIDFKSATSSCSATGYTFTSPATYALSSSTAAPSSSASSGPTCSNPYKVQDDDTCASIALAQNVSTEGILNSGGISSSCSNLHAVGSLCLPPPCVLYQVQVDDTCESILEAYPDITGSQFLAWNPNVNRICGNLMYFTDTYICVGPPGGSLDPVASSTPVSSSTPLETPSSRATTPALKPSNAPPLSTSRCGKWYVVKQEDNCQSIANRNNIAPDDFNFLNPGLNSTCGNLELNAAYCVQAVGDISTYSGYPTTSLPYALTSMQFTTTSASTLPKAPPPSVTSIVPLPTAPGTVSNCKDYIEYVTIPNVTEQAESQDITVFTANINSCDFAISAYEVTLNAFLDWNPILANVTPCYLQPGYRYCLTNGTDESFSEESSILPPLSLTTTAAPKTKSAPATGSHQTMTHSA